MVGGIFGGPSATRSRALSWHGCVTQFSLQGKSKVSIMFAAGVSHNTIKAILYIYNISHGSSTPLCCKQCCRKVCAQQEPNQINHETANSSGGELNIKYAAQ